MSAPRAEAAFPRRGKGSGARRAALVFPLIGVLHEIRYICARGVVGCQVRSDEEVGGVVGEGVLCSSHRHHRYHYAARAAFGGMSGCRQDAIDDRVFALE